MTLKKAIQQNTFSREGTQVSCLLQKTWCVTEAEASPVSRDDSTEEKGLFHCIRFVQSSVHCHYICAILVYSCMKLNPKPLQVPAFNLNINYTLKMKSSITI